MYHCLNYFFFLSHQLFFFAVNTFSSRNTHSKVLSGIFKIQHCLALILQRGELSLVDSILWEILTENWTKNCKYVES